MELNRLYNMDCMEGMKQFPDKFFELAIVDPPYGIDKQLRGGRPFGAEYKKKGWDTAPDCAYFDELFRVSRNQIIWGGNYFGLGRTRGFIVWDKMNDGRNFSECEFAWTSFDTVARFFRMRFIGKKESSHPTEKPVQLYKWLLSKYAHSGDKILDTHAGSCSSLVACIDMRYDYVGFELDGDYYRAALNRISQFKQQTRLFQ